VPAPRWVQRVYLLLMCVVFATCVSTLIKIRLELGPLGEAIPRDPPQEANRIQSAELGLSIVLPTNWQHKSIGDQLHVHPRAVGRTPSALFISTVERPPETDLVGCRLIQIQGNVGYEKTALRRRGTIDDPSTTESTIFMKVGPQWLQVVLLIEGEFSMVPPMILQYVETIRVAGGPTAG